ncbi:unnamed protein product [Ceutorhynchus assimilis]|uniref:Dynein regulatory complex protein 9 n=1 Tax=Ceutorhynchus assimilis TaxID=467358 RepID=A0A9N9QQ17_9CUCU|nr:unnamed protein product [Ceutorhynchus assimilis]
MALQKTYYQERAMFRREIDEVMTKIGNLKDEIEDFQQEADIKLKYLQSWQNGKIEMENYTLNKKEEKTSETILESQQDLTKEDRVHLEIGNIFNEIDLDYQRQIKTWKLKYEHDLKTMNAKIMNLQMKKDEQQDKTAAMVKKYIQRQDQIDAYKEHKVEQEKLKQEKRRKDNAATKVQSWWRGTMNKIKF